MANKRLISIFILSVFAQAFAFSAERPSSAPPRTRIRSSSTQVENRNTMNARPEQRADTAPAQGAGSASSAQSSGSSTVQNSASRRPAVRNALSYTVYKEHFFKIRAGKDYIYSLNTTSAENIKAHKWKKGNKLLEIRVAFDFVHLSWKAMREYYLLNTQDLYSSVKLLKEGQRNVNGSWIWYAKLKAVLKTGESVSVKLILTKNRNIAYFISVIAGENDASAAELYTMVNSLKFY
jgi:hypothetical protein